MVVERPIAQRESRVLGVISDSPMRFPARVPRVRGYRATVRSAIRTSLVHQCCSRAPAKRRVRTIRELIPLVADLQHAARYRTELDARTRAERPCDAPARTAHPAGITFGLVAERVDRRGSEAGRSTHAAQKVERALGVAPPIVGHQSYHGSLCGIVRSHTVNVRLDSRF